MVATSVIAASHLFQPASRFGSAPEGKQMRAERASRFDAVLASRLNLLPRCRTAQKLQAAAGSLAD